MSSTATWGGAAWGGLSLGGFTEGDVETTVPPGVSIAFDADPMDASPEWTRIDNLPGCKLQSWTITRGRRTEFEKVSAGTAVIRIVDLQGLFDPTNGDSPYFPVVQFLVDKQVAISLRDPVLDVWYPRFRGFIENIDYTLSQKRDHMMLELEVVDGLGWLTDAELEIGADGDLPSPVPDHVFYEDTTGGVDNRIREILEDVGWDTAAMASIFTGNVNLQEVTYPPGTQALAAIDDCVDGEFPGGVATRFVDVNGVFIFHGRLARFRPDVAEYGINRRDVGDDSATDSDPTICPIFEMTFNLGKATLFNRATVIPKEDDSDVLDANVDNQTVEDATSIAAHGVKAIVFNDLLTLEGLYTGNDKWEECILYATYYRDNYKDPLPRISRLVFKSLKADHLLAGPLWRMMCRSEIGDLLSVYTGHPDAGGFEGDGYFIEGIRQTVNRENAQGIYEVVLEVDVSPQALFANDPFDSDPNPGALS